MHSCFASISWIACLRPQFRAVTRGIVVLPLALVRRNFLALLVLVVNGCADVLGLDDYGVTAPASGRSYEGHAC